MDLLKETAWHGDPEGTSLFVDESRAMFHAIGAVQGSVLSLAKPSIISKILKATSAGFAGNLDGDGWTMGGLLLVSKQGVAYEYHETDFGERADPEDVVQAVKRLMSAEQ